MELYYYLKGPEKVGPIHEEELKRLGLSPETLVWKEGFENWKAISEVPNLKSSIPPPIPDLIVNDENSKKSETKVRNTVILFASLISIGMICSYFALQSKRRDLQSELTVRVNNLMRGNDRIISANYARPIGELLPLKKPTRLPKLKRDTNILPIIDSLADSYMLSQYYRDKQSGIISRFTLEQGGFTIKELKKQDEGYELTTTISEDLIYKRLPSIYHTRASIDEAYTAGMNFYKDEAKSNFSYDSYSYLQNVEFVNNELFELNNMPNSLTHHSSSQGTSSISFASHEVFVRVYSKFFKIQLREGKYENMLLIYILCGMVISIILCVIILLIKPFNWLK